VGPADWTDKLEKTDLKEKLESDFDRSISLQLTLFRIGWFAGPLG
jgi:hypothetical protein